MLPLDFIVLMAVPPAEEEPVPLDQLELRLPDQVLVEKGWSLDDWQSALFRLSEAGQVDNVFGQGWRRTDEGDKIVSRLDKPVELGESLLAGDEVALILSSLRLASISVSQRLLLHYVVCLGWVAMVEMLPILIRRGMEEKHRDFQSLTADFVDWSKF